MLAGVYSGVEIEPDTARDYLVRLAFHQKQLAEIRRMHLLALAAAGGKPEAITEQFEAFKGAFYPPVEGREAEREAEMLRAMQDFEAISERFFKTTKKLTPLKI